MKKLRIAMIGCGRISEMYRQVFQQISDRSEVVFSVDPNKEKAEEFARNFKGCLPLSDYRDCFGKDIDVFHIATPHYLHPIIAIDAMRHGINVLTEKPMAIRLCDADKMIRVAEEEHIKLGVIFQTRYVKGCMEIKKLIDDGRLGRILSAKSYLSWSRKDEYYLSSDWKGTWEKEGGGVLIDQAIHSLDRVQWLVGSDIDWIEGHIANRAHKAVKVEDVAEAFVGFKNACLYQLYACNCYSYDSPIEIEIAGENGTVGLRQDLAWVNIKGEQPYEIRDGEDGISVGLDYWGSSHITQIKDYYRSIQEDYPVLIDGREGRKALELVRGIYKSANEHKRVFLPFDDTEYLLKNGLSV